MENLKENLLDLIQTDSEVIVEFQRMLDIDYLHEEIDELNRNSCKFDNRLNKIRKEILKIRKMK